MKGNYIIDSKKMIITAKVGSLTEKQTKKIRNYIALGYTLEEYVKPINEKFKKENVIKYLNEHGTEEQKKKFNKVMNEPTKKGTLKKDGTPKTKGFVAGLQYFKEQFPDY